MYKKNSSDLFLPKLRQFFPRKSLFFCFLLGQLSPLPPACAPIPSSNVENKIPFLVDEENALTEATLTSRKRS